MLGNEAQAATLTTLLATVSAANTAAATTGTYIDVRRFEGDIAIILQPGAITGSITPQINDATDASGTGAAAITPNEGAPTALVANTGRKYTIKASATRGFIGFIGTIVTGPALIGVSIMGRPKNF